MISVVKATGLQKLFSEPCVPQILNWLDLIICKDICMDVLDM